MRGVGLLMLVVAAACSPSGSEGWRAGDPARYDKGQQVYTQYCAECHGANGEGQNPNNPLAPDETGRYPAPPHDETGHTWHHDDDLLVTIVRDGGMGDPTDFYPMPAFGETLTDEQIEAVIYFIKGMWTDEQRQYQQEVTKARQAGE
jgi:mono/diheme cytochrome c family protein